MCIACYSRITLVYSYEYKCIDVSDIHTLYLYTTTTSYRCDMYSICVYSICVYEVAILTIVHTTLYNSKSWNIFYF